MPPETLNLETVPTPMVEELHGHISKMNRDKAPGVDDIPVEVFETSKEAADELAALVVYANSVVTHCRLHCKQQTHNPTFDPGSCPPVGSMLAIRKWDEIGGLDWHICTVVRINDRNRMRISVEYFDGEPREDIHLADEQWGFICYPQPKGASRTGSAAGKIVKESKRKAVQAELKTVRLEKKA